MKLTIALCGLLVMSGCSFDGRGLRDQDEPDGPPISVNDAADDPADPIDAAPDIDAQPGSPDAAIDAAIDAAPGIDAEDDPVDAEPPPQCAPGHVLSRARLSWQDAEDECEDMDMHLVVINDQAEHAAVVALLNQQAPGNEQAWIGFTDLACGNNQFIAVTGEVVDIPAAAASGWGWADSEPSNGGHGNNSDDGAENCVVLRENGSSDWNDEGCSITHAFVCECDDDRGDAKFYSPPDDGGVCPL